MVSSMDNSSSSPQTVMKWKTVLAVFVVVVAYLVIGGLVFRALEQPFESNQKNTIALEKSEFLQKHPCVKSGELEALIQLVLILGKEYNIPLFISILQLIVMIHFTGDHSYGNIAPSTEGGKIFCIFYALFGIPLFGFLLAGIGDQLGTIFVKSIARVEKVFRKKQITQTKIRVISTIMFILLGCIVFVTIPAVIFQSIEEWETLDSLYFVVITLTTVGFGDYVAGGNKIIHYREWYKPLVWFWILVGLAYFAAVLSMIGDWLRVISKKTKEEVGEIKAHAAEWKASVRAEFRETRRRMSTDIHDKLQRAATMRSMERRRLGLDQRAHSLDMLSPEKRAVFASLDTDRFKTSSQESIDAKLNNLRLRMSEQYDQQGSSEDNIFNRFSSLTRLAKRNKNKDLKKNIPDDVKKIYENFGSCSTDEEKREDEQEKECNTSVPDIENTPRSELQNGSIPNVTKEYDNK
ncbi:UNVERIFIED_CONTAM: hypothetical protein FKN15_018206 [Acipenser sinensis]